MNLGVVIVNDNGVPMAEGMCHNIHPQDCIDENPFGTEDVGVVILESLIHSKVDPTHRFSLCKWPLTIVTIDGVSLHERRHLQNKKELQTNIRPRKGLQKFETLACSILSTNECKRQRLLKEVSIREIARIGCCMYSYCQLIPRDKMKAIREEMWLEDFHLRSTKRLDVHRAIHVNGAGCKVITLESIDVCCTAWYTIHSVSKVKFYKQTGYAKEGCRSRHHGNVGLNNLGK